MQRELGMQQAQLQCKITGEYSVSAAVLWHSSPGLSQGGPDETAALTNAHSLRGETPILNIQLQRGVKGVPSSQATTVLLQYSLFQAVADPLNVLLIPDAEDSQRKVLSGGENSTGNS